MYKCVYCGKNVKVDLSNTKKIICPGCGYRILERQRPKIIKKVKSV